MVLERLSFLLLTIIGLIQCNEADKIADIDINNLSFRMKITRHGVIGTG